MMYPDWQWKYWLRSIFIPKNDFVYGVSPEATKNAGKVDATKVGRVPLASIVATGVLAAVVGGMLVVDRGAVKKEDLNRMWASALGLVKG